MSFDLISDLAEEGSRFARWQRRRADQAHASHQGHYQVWLFHDHAASVALGVSRRGAVGELEDADRPVGAGMLMRGEAEELRKYQPAPDGGPADLAMQRYACSMLLDHAGLIPDPLEAELGAYVLQLDHAMNTRIVQPDMTDTDFLDAVAGILRSPLRGQRILEDIRDLVKRSGRGTATYQRQASDTATVTHISKTIKESDSR